MSGIVALVLAFLAAGSGLFAALGDLFTSIFGGTPV